MTAEIAPQPATPSDKYQRVDAGSMLLPACCAGCGTVTDDEGFVDTRIDLEFYGVVYFCSSCALALANVFGDSPYRHVIERLNTMARELAVAQGEILRLENVVDNFAIARIGPTVSNSNARSKRDSAVKTASAGSDSVDDILGELVVKQGTANPKSDKSAKNIESV